MAKLLASEASWDAANACLDTHGGFGFAEEYDVERKFRETRLYTGRAGLQQPDPRLPRPARARHAALVLDVGEPMVLRRGTHGLPPAPSLHAAATTHPCDALKNR